MWRVFKKWCFLITLDLIISVVLCGRHLAMNLAMNRVPISYESPCPDVFQYFVQHNQIQYGQIQVYCPDDNNIQLNVEMSIGNDIQGYNGDLSLASSRMKTIEDIIHRRMIHYKLHFPRWQNIPPKITKITLNGNIICYGPPINIKTVRILTTVNLQHTLKINMPSNMENKNPKPVSRFEPTINTNPTLNYLPSPQPTATSINEFIQNTQINFNPTPPKDLTKIYPGNPFLDTIKPRVELYGPYSAEDEDSTPKFQTFNKFQDVGIPQNSFGLNSEICGLSVDTNALVANGKDVSKGQYPWLVAIFLIRDFGTEFLCGGNLISKKHVITAAHCMKNSDRILTVKKIFLKLGQHNIQRWTPDTGSLVLDAIKIAVHPDYHSMSSDGDIALITLSDGVEFTKYIRPICLWTENDDLNVVVHSVGTVVGWGKDESNNVITPEPKQIDFPIVSQEMCLRSHHTFREITSSRTFCAGYRNGSGPCNGDSGGGFLLKRRDQWTLRGLVSMSIAKDKTCDFSEYFVFTDVAKFKQWILSNIN